MSRSLGLTAEARSAVFAPLAGPGRSEQVEQRMREAIKRAANPAPALPPMEITPAGIRAMKEEMRALGLRAGFITQAEIDAALGYDDDQAAEAKAA